MATRQLFGRVIVLIAVLALLGGAVAAWNARVDPSTISQAQLHRYGTTANGVVMAPRPSQRPVVIRPLSVRDIQRTVRSYLPRWLGGLPDIEIQGYFDPESGEIHITGEVTRLQAMTPIPMLQNRFRHALRHEYGHALLDEWLRSEATDEEAIALVPSITRRDERGLDAVPPKLRAVVSEYRSVDEMLYGSSYYSSYFTEYFAESYSRFLEGKRVPPRTKRLLSTFVQREPD